MTILAPFTDLRAKLRAYDQQQCCAEADRRERTRIVRAAQDRAAWAQRRFEQASAEYVAVHLSTAIRAPEHEKKGLRALHADVLETRQAAKDLEAHSW